jgi:hypothetical protein
MTTPLKHPVKRLTETVHRGRQLIITLLPGDLIEIRQARCRKAELLTIGGAYDYAVKIRVSRELYEKKQKKGKK